MTSSFTVSTGRSEPCVGCPLLIWPSWVNITTCLCNFLFRCCWRLVCKFIIVSQISCLLQFINLLLFQVFLIGVGTHFSPITLAASVCQTCWEIYTPFTEQSSFLSCKLHTLSMAFRAFSISELLTISFCYEFIISCLEYLTLHLTIIRTCSTEKAKYVSTLHKPYQLGQRHSLYLWWPV